MAATRARVAASVVSPIFSSGIRLLARITGATTSTTSQSLSSMNFHTSGCDLGGRPKSVWRKRRHPANTRINHELPEKIKQRKAFGGHHKMKALRVNKGLYELKSQDVELETPILRVVHSYANASHLERQVIVKGSIVQVDNTPFHAWYQEHKQHTTDDSIENDQHSASFLQGSLFAKITSRPGQEGACNGYILEGEELQDLEKEIELSATQPMT